MLKELEEHQKYALLKLIDEVQDYAIILLDVDGNIQNWNSGAQRIKGYSAEEIIGKNFRSFYTKTDLKNGKPEGLINIAKTKGIAHDEGWRVRKDGTRFWGSITITAIHGKDNEIIGFGKLTRDLSLKKRAEQARQRHVLELELKNQELEQFAFIASHDLQEPLRSLISFTDILESEYKGKIDEDFDQYIAFISQSSRRMKELVSGLLDYSRIGKQSEQTNVDCNELLKAVMEDMTAVINENKAEVNVETLPTICGYPMELRQLFQNLVSNALKFTKEGEPPKLNIYAERKAEEWIFSVEDNGIGIDKDHREKIFIIFKRLHNRDDYPGTGIGLAHCRKIVELHGGKIWVEPKPGGGSIFKFSLPIS